MESRAIVLRAIQKHTDGIPESMQDLYEKDLYKEQAHDILMEIVKETGALEHPCIYKTDEATVLYTGNKPMVIDGSVIVSDGGEIMCYTGSSEELKQIK